MQTPYESSSAVNLSIGEQSSGPYIVEHDDSTQQGGGLFGWIASSNFMNKMVEKTKVCSALKFLSNCSCHSQARGSVMFFEELRSDHFAHWDQRRTVLPVDCFPQYTSLPCAAEW